MAETNGMDAIDRLNAVARLLGCRPAEVPVRAAALWAEVETLRAKRDEALADLARNDADLP